MNIKKLAEDLGLEEEEYLELFKLFIETGRSDLEKLQTAIKARDTEQIANTAHSLKGACGNLGFMELHEIAGEIIEKARNNQLEGISESFNALKEKFDGIVELSAPRKSEHEEKDIGG